MKRVQTYNPSDGIRRQLPLHRGAYMKRVQTYNPSVGIRRQLYQGTPTYAAGITPAPLHRGAYTERVQTQVGALTQGSLYGVSNTTNTRKGDNTYEFWKCGMGIPRNTP